MPTLDWIGKGAVVKHHKDVPYRLLEPVAELSHADAQQDGNSGNLIVQGDNLHALKALLPRYAGQVKCIYIDPPYNTGNEGWVYNDNVNSPTIRKWLHETVGREGEDLSRHDKWLAQAMQDAVTSDTARAVIAEAATQSRRRAAEAFFHTPAESGETLHVPQMALRIQGALELFDDPALLDIDWEPPAYEAAPTKTDLERLDANRLAEGGRIDVTAGGQVTTEFIADLQRDLGLSYVPENWDEVRLATWLCKNLPEPTITHAAKRAFVAHWLRELLRRSDFDLARINRQKFLVRELLENRIRELQQTALDAAYQTTLFGDGAERLAAVPDDYAFEFPPHGYAPGRYDDGEYGRYRFKKHYYGQIGAFDSQEEFDCACWLDQQAERGPILFWVRNPVRREGCSFFLQKADGRFYPDFICKLPGDTILVVEYKGANQWTTDKSKADRAIGGLWAELSGGRCRFVMVTNREWSRIEALLSVR